MLLGVPGFTTRRKDALGQRCLPSGRRVCVTLGVIGILLDFNLFYRRGAGCSCKYQPNEEVCIEH